MAAARTKRARPLWMKLLFAAAAFGFAVLVAEFGVEKVERAPRKHIVGHTKELPWEVGYNGRVSGCVLEHVKEAVSLGTVLAAAAS